MTSKLGREDSAEEILAGTKSTAVKRQEAGFGVLEY